MRRAGSVIVLAAVAIAGCGGGASPHASPSASTSSRTVSSTTTSRTTSGARTATVPKHAFELADCLHAEKAATRLATDAIRHDTGAGHDATALMRTDLTRLVTDLDAIFPSTPAQAGQLRRTRRAVRALEGQDAAGVVRGLGRPPASGLASLLTRACS